VDPIRFLVWFRGQSAGDPNDSQRWIQDMLFMGLRATLTGMIKAGELSLMDLGTCGPEVARAMVRSCPDLQNIGVQVLEVAKLNVNLSEEDQARIDEMQDQIVQANVDAKAAQRRIKQAEAEAAQRQFQLDQDFQNRARYINQLDMGRYQQLAAAEATMGLGQGLAQGGEGASAGAAGAAVVGGLGLGAGLMAGARVPMPGYGYPPPGYPPGYPPPGYPPGYPPAGYPPAGFPPPQQAGRRRLVLPRRRRAVSPPRAHRRLRRPPCAAAPAARKTPEPRVFAPSAAGPSLLDRKRFAYNAFWA
jgi:hypothetical protein